MSDSAGTIQTSDEVQTENKVEGSVTSELVSLFQILNSDARKETPINVEENLG